MKTITQHDILLNAVITVKVKLVVIHVLTFLSTILFLVSASALASGPIAINLLLGAASVFLLYTLSVRYQRATKERETAIVALTLFESQQRNKP